MASRVAALLLLGLLCIAFTAADIPIDCCNEVSANPLPFQLLASYRIQEPGEGCKIGATVFITKKGKNLCVVHYTEKRWVRAAIKHLDTKMR